MTHATTPTQADPAGILAPSPQQQDALDWAEHGSGSALVTAVAGSGKTTTLLKMLGRIPNNGSRFGTTVAFCAYNKAIAVEIQGKVERAKAAGEIVASVRAGTFHSFGFGAWRRVAPQVKVDAKKMDTICETLGVPEAYRSFVKDAVSLAKQRAFGVLCSVNDASAWYDMIAHYDLEDALAGDGAEALEHLGMDDRVTEGLRWAYRALAASVKQDREVVDFDDMIYAPLVHNARVWQNDWVLVDEAQDTNPARRALAKKMLRPGGRFVAVGDPRQAIYGFTGADNDALELIKREFGCTELPLTVTYRCPKAVVRFAQQWVSHIEAAATAPEGAVLDMPEAIFQNLPATELGPDAAVLCRNTAPLVDLAFALIRRGIPCHVEGKDIGRGLLALAGKWKVKTCEGLRTKLDQYLTRESARLLAKGQEQKAENLADRVQTLMVIMSGLPAGATVADLRQSIEALFGDTPDGQPAENLTLSTVHKSKGREWPTVYLLGRARFMPSPYARQDWQLEQEENLIYVAATRAQERLVEVHLPPRQKKGQM